MKKLNEKQLEKLAGGEHGCVVAVLLGATLGSLLGAGVGAVLGGLAGYNSTYCQTKP